MEKKIYSLALLSLLTGSLIAQNWGGSTPGNIYYNQGKVGIGLSNPQWGLLEIKDASDSENALIRLGIGKLSMGGHSELLIDAVGISGGRFIVKENGYVGIGTTDPKTSFL